MPQSSVFPIYIKTIYDGSGAGFDGFAEEAKRAVDQSKRLFEQGAKEIKSLTKSIGFDGGRINLDTAGVKQAASDARLAEQALADLLSTTRDLARLTGDTSASTKAFTQAIAAQLAEARGATREADAQAQAYTKLQAALNATTSANGRLAQSYRETFAEAAKAAQAEVRARDFQEGINSRFAPGLNRSAAQSGAGFAALEAREAMDELRRAEVGAAEGARILEAAHRGTALEMGRTTKSARESAQAFMEADREANQLAAEMQNLLRAANPAAAAQEDFRRATERVEQSLRRGIITTEQAQQANAQLRAEMARGVGMMGNVRQASVQTGQQLQDIAISLYSGQRAGVVFAQQLPQLAFALSSLEGSANKTQDRIGRLATFLSGPWGLAVGLAVGVLGTYIASLFGAGDEADKAKGKTYDFSKSLDVLRLSATESANAMQQLEQATRGAISAQGDFLNVQAATAKASVTDLEGRIKKASTELAAIKKENDRFDYFGTGLGAVPLVNYRRKSKLEEQLASDRAALESAKAARTNAEIALSQRQVNESLDAGTKAAGEYARAIGELNARYKESIEGKGDPLSGRFITKADYQKEYERLTVLKKAAEDAAREAKKVDRAPTLPRVTGGEVARLIGFREDQIRSGKRTAAQNKAVGGAANSYHLTGQAIDLPLTLNGKPLTKEGIRASLEEAGVIIKELLGPGDKGHSDHFHVAFAAKRGTPDQLAKLRDRAMAESTRETERLSRVSDQAAEAVARITSQYDQQPRVIDQIALALRNLKALRESLFDPKNVGPDGKSLVPNADAILQGIGQAEAAVRDAPMQRLRDMEEAAQEQAAMDTLRLQNRNSEVEVLGRVLDLQRGGLAIDEAVVGRVMQIVGAEQLRSLELEKQNIAQQRNLELMSRTQSNLRSGIRELLDGKGFNAIGNVISRQFDIYKDGLADQIAESLFGDTFRDQKLKILGLDKVDEAGRNMATKITELVASLEMLRQAAEKTAGGIAANDNGGMPSISNAAASVSAMLDGMGNPWGLTSGAAGVGSQIVKEATHSVTQDLGNSMRGLMKRFLGVKLADNFDQLTKGAGIGGILASMLSGGNGTATGIGAGIGGLAKAFSKPGSGIDKLFKGIESNLPVIGTAIAANQALNSLFGNDDREGGKFLHTILGPFASLLFKKKSGSTTISSIDGDLRYSGTKSYREGVLAQGGAVQDGLRSIVDRLGGEEGAFRVSIGKRGKDFTVDPTGGGRTKGSGVLKFKSEEEAVRAALLDAINDGAVAGLRQGAQNLLRAGKDIERQVQKAFDFEQVFTRLKRYKDPIGAALDDLDKEFRRLQTIFTEANATTEERAQLEELYGLERAKAIKAATEQITASLRSLYDELTINNSALSLRDRKSEVLAKYNPLADRVRAGDTSAYDDFAEAARALLGIERELSGSGSGYFSLLEEVTKLTKSTLDATTATAEASANRTSPFAPPTANDNEAVIGAMNQLGFFIVNGLMIPLTAINENLRSLVLHGYVSGNGNGGPVLNANVSYF